MVNDSFKYCSCFKRDKKMLIKAKLWLNPWEVCGFCLSEVVGIVIVALTIVCKYAQWLMVSKTLQYYILWLKEWSLHSAIWGLLPLVNSVTACVSDFQLIKQDGSCTDYQFDLKLQYLEKWHSHRSSYSHHEWTKSVTNLKLGNT